METVASLDGKKAPCIYQMPGTTSFIQRCSFKGGGPSKAQTAGIFNRQGNSVVQNCTFHSLIAGGIIAELSPKTSFVCRDNAFVSCLSTGLYLEAKQAARPFVLHNVFMVCKCSAIILNSHVDAFVALNELQINDTAIELTNNNSILYGNKVQKSHANGIAVKCTAAKLPPGALPVRCRPKIIRNFVEGSTQSGIICEGQLCKPLISANTIEANRKTGIKLAFCARAHIGDKGESSNELSGVLDVGNHGAGIGGPDDR